MVKALVYTMQIWLDGLVRSDEVFKNKGKHHFERKEEVIVNLDSVFAPMHFNSLIVVKRPYISETWHEWPCW